MAEERSPIKGNTLRNPGQSCEDRRRQLFEDKLEGPILAASVSVVLTLFEIWRSYSKAPPMPWVYALMAFGAIAFLGFRMRRYLPEIKNLKLAAEGERAVGQYLERLRSQGYDVFHDVPADGFNVDHVIIGPAGIFTVETKTWRKPLRGDARITFDGEKLLKDGLKPDRDPVTQAKAQASWLARELAESTGRKYVVKPVVLFPGWYVENPEGAFRQMWVLEPKALPTFLKNEPVRLDTEDVRLASYHLSRHIRTYRQQAPGS